MRTKSKIETLRDLVRHGANSGLSPAQLQRATLALKRLESEETSNVIEFPRAVAGMRKAA